MEDNKWSLDDFELGKRVGTGTYGRVYSAREKKSGYIVALKTILKAEVLKCGAHRHVMTEIENQSHLKHPNVLQLLTWFQDDFRIFLVFEYVGGGVLYDHLKNSPGGRFPEPLCAKYTYQVADALAYCHKNHVIHRGIKPENLCLTLEDNIQLAEFAWSVHAPSKRRQTMCGTLDFVAPEMLNRSGYGTPVDIWCLGILCYEFCVGSKPFETLEIEEACKRIQTLSMSFPDFMPPGAVDLIEKLLVLDPLARLSLEGTMSHPWILKYVTPEKM